MQFGVKRTLIGDFVRHDVDKSPDEAPWYPLRYTFAVEPGTAKLPRAPITAKASELARREVLERA